jgi:putative protein kinase ArgK-like GTPase of G3E family
VNKADAAGADALHRTLMQALAYSTAPAARPEVVLTSASRGDGVAALVDLLMRHGAPRRRLFEEQRNS